MTKATCYFALIEMEAFIEFNLSTRKTWNGIDNHTLIALHCCQLTRDSSSDLAVACQSFEWTEASTAFFMGRGWRSIHSNLKETLDQDWHLDKFAILDLDTAMFLYRDNKGLVIQNALPLAQTQLPYPLDNYSFWKRIKTRQIFD